MTWPTRLEWFRFPASRSIAACPNSRPQSKPKADPDPTKLTTDAVNAAKADIEKLFDTKLHALRTELELPK